MPLTDWITITLFGMLFGAVGQGIRTIPGFVNLKHERLTGGRRADDDFNATSLVVSLLLGAVAGAIAALTMNEKLMVPKVTIDTVLGVIAAGYTGADFIQGFIGKHFGTGTSVAAAGDNAAAAAGDMAPAPAPTPAPAPAVAPPIVPAPAPVPGNTPVTAPQGTETEAVG